MATEAALARFAFRRTRRGALLWGSIFALVNIASGIGFAATFPDQVSRDAFARSVSGGGGLDIMFGRAHEIQTVAGFVAWRSLLTSAILAGLWGLLRGTQALRGEEEAGRWELLLSSPTTPGRATMASLAGLGMAWLLLLVTDAALSVGVLAVANVSLDTPGLLYLCFGQCIPAALFMALGAVASQLAATRTQATAYCAAFLGTSFVIRLVADEASGLDWTSWLSPLGWTESMRPLTDNDLLPALLYLLLIAAGLAATWRLGRDRDLGASTFPSVDRRPARSTKLTGPFGLEVRLQRARTLAWCASLLAGGALLGWLSRSVGDAISKLSSEGGFGRVIRSIGPDQGAIAFLDVEFTLASITLMILAASQVGLARQEEATGRLDNLLVRPVSRAQWLGARMVAAFLALCASALAMGVGGWLGATSHGVGVTLPRMLEAGLNAALPGTVVLGLGFLVLGLAPRVATAFSYALAASSFLIDVVGAAVNPPGWVLDLSILHHVAAVPSAHIRWTDAAWMAALALDACILASYSFAGRDILTE